MYYLDYAKKVDDSYVLNFFADSAEDIKDVPTDKPYITRNGTNYGIPLDTSVVTIIEEGTKVNYVLQNGAYIAGGDVAPVVGTLEATENKTYLAKDENLDGYNQVVVNVQPKLQEKSATANGAVTPDSDFQGLSKVTVNVPATPTEEKTVVLALADGDQVITPTDGKNISKVTITKPVELLPENIKKGITIAGVTGTYEAVTGAE